MVASGWVVSRLATPGKGDSIGRRAVVLALIVGLVYLPNLPMSIASAKLDSGPPQEWREALTWLRENTPEPFDSPITWAAWRDPAFKKTGVKRLPAMVVKSGDRVIGTLSGTETGKPETNLRGVLK